MRRRSLYVLILSVISLAAFGQGWQTDTTTGNVTLSAGNAGIKVSSPAFPLHIAGPSTRSVFKVMRDDGAGGISATILAGGNSLLGFDADYTPSGWIAAYPYVAAIGTSGGTLHFFGSAGNTVGSPVTGAITSHLGINLSSGFVGIGTGGTSTSPLQLQGPTTASQFRITAPSVSNVMSFHNYGLAQTIAFDADWANGSWTGRATNSSFIYKVGNYLHLAGSSQTAGSTANPMNHVSVDLATGNVGFGITPSLRFQIGPHNTYNTLTASLTGDVRLPAYHAPVGGYGIAFLQARDSGTNPIGLQIRTQPAAGVITDAIHITPTGLVGILTNTPQVALHVAGEIRATGAITGGTVIGATYQDIAEWVPVTEQMTPGTVVIVNPEKINEVMPSSGAYDTRVAGVVSAQPGVILGVAADTKAQIATTGRVRVKADATKAPIAVGDLLVTSPTRGTAMKSMPVDVNGIAMHRPGTIIGKALEPLKSGEGEILVLLSLQ